MQRRNEKRGGEVERLDPTLAEVMKGLEKRICSDEELEAAERSMHVTSRRSMLQASGILEVLPDDDVRALCDDTLDDTEALKRVREFMAQTAYSVGTPICILLGGTGVGKTVAAAWALARRPGLFVEAERFVRFYEGRWKTQADEFQRILRCELLVLDELGTEEDLARAIPAYRELVNRRQSRQRPTIFLGNLNVANLKKRFEPRTWNRLEAHAEIRGVVGPSLRRRRTG